jgi:hypothetical protein
VIFQRLIWLSRRVSSAIVFGWVLIGALASVERAYFQKPPIDCAHIVTIAGAISAGPLNYFGLDPHIESCHLQLARSIRAAV